MNLSFFGNILYKFGETKWYRAITGPGYIG